MGSLITRMQRGFDSGLITDSNQGPKGEIGCPYVLASMNRGIVFSIRSIHRPAKNCVNDTHFPKKTRSNSRFTDHAQHKNDKYEEHLFSTRNMALSLRLFRPCPLQNIQAKAGSQPHSLCHDKGSEASTLSHHLLESDSTA